MKVKMMINFVITGLLILMSAPAAAGRIPLAPNMPAEGIKSIHPIDLNFNPIFLVDNESGTAGSESQPTNGIKEQAPSSEAADQGKSGKNSDDADSKPIKPFKPSEEIAAEQAVDFPVDI
jgi:hypothetical protein